MSGRSYAPNRIKELRKAAGLTQQALGALMPSDPAIGTISKLEKGDMGLTVDWMNELAAALNVRPDELLDLGQPAHWRTLAVIGRVAAGNWREALEQPLGQVFVPEEAGGPNAIGLEVDGDSMDLVAPPGSVVIMDPDDRQLHERKIYVVLNGNGETTFKRFFANPARLEPCSTNPAHKTIILGDDNFVTLGRVTYMSMAL